MHKTLAVRVSPVVYLRMLVYSFVAVAVRAVALLPLWSLWAFPAGSPWRWLALLCPLAYVFFVLPMRFSFAEALLEDFTFSRAFSTHLYGEKIAEGVVHALHVMKWGLPTLCLGIGYFFWYSYLRDMNAGAFFELFGSLGKGMTDVINLVAYVPDGGVVEGLIVALIPLGIGLLVWLYGAVRNSATRYLWVLATAQEHDLRKERRRRLMGRRLRQLGVALVNLALFVPSLVAAGIALKDSLIGLSDAMLSALIAQTPMGLDATRAVWPLVLSFVLFYLPLLPVRRALTAAFATRDVKHTASTAS